jgi:hypothetical protein
MTCRTASPSARWSIPDALFSTAPVAAACMPYRWYAAVNAAGKGGDPPVANSQKPPSSCGFVLWRRAGFEPPVTNRSVARPCRRSAIVCYCVWLNGFERELAPGRCKRPGHRRFRVDCSVIRYGVDPVSNRVVSVSPPRTHSISSPTCGSWSNASTRSTSSAAREVPITGTARESNLVLNICC